jgi:ABC-type lipoprotein export system ATPase subunit
MKKSNNVIRLVNITKEYPLGKKDRLTAVKGVNLEIKRGEFVVITGRSGSGKTTMLNLIAGLTVPTSGTVLYHEEEVWKLPDARQAQLRNQHIGFVFQFPSLIPSLNVYENVLLPALFHHKNNRQEAKKRAIALLHEVGLDDKLHTLPRQLSAGQQQRVVIARSLINKPELLLADEPTSNLDEQTEHEIMALFQKIHREHEITIMLVTHSIELASYGTHGIRMAGGEIVVGETAGMIPNLRQTTPQPALQ